MLVLGILITTSRYPTRRVRSFVKDLVSIIPNALSTNRGTMNLMDVAAYAIKNDCNRVAIVNTWKGNPGKINLYEIRERKLLQISPIVYIKGVVLRRELRESPYKKARIRLKQVFYYINSIDKSDRSYNLLKSMFSFFGYKPIDSISIVKDGQAFSYATKINSQIRIEIKIRQKDRFFDVGPILRIVLMEVPKHVQSKVRDNY